MKHMQNRNEKEACRSFKHLEASTVDEAVSLLSSYKGKATVIAGGTDLLNVLKDRILPSGPEAVINLKTIPGLDGIEENADGLKIGALTRLKDIVSSSLIKENYPLLWEAARSVASPQIRNMGTIGGNLCQDVRCWYYRYPHQLGGRIFCFLKGGKSCYALTGENQYHSIFGGVRSSNPPCSSGCPANIDIASYLSYIRENRLRDAAELILRANPIPAVTGRVCPHYCVQECNRADFDEPVSIRDIERYLGDYILENAGEIVRQPGDKSGKRVAIVGSGPAGLTAAYYLALEGYTITIFEALPEPGGWLRYVIPDYRLPKEVVRKAIDYIKRLGVEIRTGVQVGRDITLADLKNQYDAVFIGVGASRSMNLEVEGEGLKNVLDGITFLRATKCGETVDLGKKVAVIGGGNTAIDCARTARRLGVQNVMLVYRRSRKEMPATAEEIEALEEEGIESHFLTTPVRFMGTSGKLAAMECIRMELGEPDESGRRRPVPVPGSETEVSVDTVITAIGQQSETKFTKGIDVTLGKSGFIMIDGATGATNIEGLFAGGDVVSGPATVIQAIAAGKRAANGIDVYLKKAEARAADKGKESVRPLLKFSREYFEKKGRFAISTRQPFERSLDSEDTSSLSLGEVESEANRCFNCGCVASSISDCAVALIALDAKVKLAGPNGKRTLSLKGFFDVLEETRNAGEIVTEILVPRPPDGAKQKYLKFRIRKALDFAIVSVGCLLTTENGVCKDARIVLGGVAPIPWRARGAEEVLKGKPINEETAAATGKTALTGTTPLSKNDYKIQLAQALVKRALLASR